MAGCGGGVRPRRGRDLKGRCLTLAQREEIALGRARGDSIRAIAAIDRPVAVDGVAGAAPQRRRAGPLSGHDGACVGL